MGTLSNRTSPPTHIIYKSDFQELIHDMSETANAQAKKQFKQTIMLYINEKLYNENQITEEMYQRAKTEILRKTA